MVAHSAEPRPTYGNVHMYAHATYLTIEVLVSGRRDGDVPTPTAEVGTLVADEAAAVVNQAPEAGR
jgi:hypothetical protein